MAKQRYIQDSFWTDPYIEKLTPDEKLIFVYLLTNPQCNVAGVYEIRPKRVAYETGYDAEVVETILNRFAKDSKVIRVKDYIIIKNHLKHQSLGNSTATGINRIVEGLPQEIQTLFTLTEMTNTKNETYPVYTLHRGSTNGRVVKLSKVKLNKNKYGEFQNVLLTDEEYEKIKDKLDIVEELSGYIASTGKRYSSHYATILNWNRRKTTQSKDLGTFINLDK